MKAWKAFLVGFAVATCIECVYLKALVMAPDYNPFYAYQISRDKQCRAALASVEAVILRCHQESGSYPADKGELLVAVRQELPKISSMVAEMSFVYRGEGDSYLLFWATKRRKISRNFYLIQDRARYLTLGEYVRSNILHEDGSAPVASPD